MQLGGSMEYINIILIICLFGYLISKRENDIDITDGIKDVPSSVLRAIQGSINPRVGKLGELLTLLDISGEYDIIIPIGKPVDFVAISEDGISFIEVKTGSSRLTDNEKKIKTLIDDGKVNFRVVRYSICAEDGGISIER